MKKTDKIVIRYAVLGVISVSIAGTLGHFIYDWTGQNRFLGLIFAVNESTWEHMKLLFFPMVVYTVFIKFTMGKKFSAAASAMMLSTLTGTALIPVIFYTYTGILGYMIDAVNISIYYISVIISFTVFTLTAALKAREKLDMTLLLIITVTACMFFLFTYNPPALGIFLDPAA